MTVLLILSNTHTSLVCTIIRALLSGQLLTLCPAQHVSKGPAAQDGHGESACCLYLRLQYASDDPADMVSQVKHMPLGAMLQTDGLSAFTMTTG